MKSSLVPTNGIHLHITEAGEGPPVLLCHGYPETWRSWRRQIAALAAAGYRAIAPDMRGYGGSSAPEAASAYTQLHIVGDLVGLLDALGLVQVALVGHDWGAITAWNAAVMRPDRFPRIAALSIPYAPRGDIDLVEQLSHGDPAFYMRRFQRPESDAAMARDVAFALRRAYHTASGTAPDAERWDPFGTPGAGNVAPETLPPWLDPGDFAHAIEAFTRSGFRGGLNYYRAIPATFELMAPFKDARVRQPSLFIAGTKDAVLDFSQPFVEKLTENAPGLTRSLLIEGAGHWLQQEAPDAVNAALLDFLGG